MNFEEIKTFCNDQSRLSEILVDNILINYAAENDGVLNKFKKKLSKYKNVISEMPKEWFGMITSQYIAYEIFKYQGLCYKYIIDKNLLSLSSSIEEYLKFQMKNPWKFSFCIPKDNPHPNFFTMVDAITNKEFLLYSPSQQDLLEEYGSIRMFFYLLSYNGVCYQTYGPATYLSGILESDLMFFSKQIDPEILFGDQIYKLIDKNPVPFMSLFYGAEVPLVFHKEHLVIENTSEYYEDDFNTEIFKDLFEVEEKYPLYKLSLIGWDEFPHFAKCYYHAKKHRLFLTSMTDAGYEKIVQVFNTVGYDLPVNPENRVTLNMVKLTEKILGVKLDLNPYADSYKDEEEYSIDPELDKINLFVKFLLEAHNANENYDIKELANVAGISLDMAYDLEKSVQKSIDRT